MGVPARARGVPAGGAPPRPSLALRSTSAVAHGGVLSAGEDGIRLRSEGEEREEEAAMR